MTEDKTDDSRSQGNPTNKDKQRDWRQICEELLKNQTSDVDGLLKELAQALERRRARD